MKKPKCKLIGKNGNIFNLMAIAGKTLSESGLKKEEKKMVERIWKSDSYMEALGIIEEYVDIE